MQRRRARGVGSPLVVPRLLSGGIGNVSDWAPTRLRPFANISRGRGPFCSPLVFPGLFVPGGVEQDRRPVQFTTLGPRSPPWARPVFVLVAGPLRQDPAVCVE